MRRVETYNGNGVNGVLLVKGSERYVFLFDDERKTEVLKQAGRWATNPELTLSWYDAAMVSMKIHSMGG